MANEPTPISLDHAQVARLLDAPPPETWCYLDVRTPQEFATGHIGGAYNIPFQFGDLAGLHPNPRFIEVAVTSFSPRTPLILGCRSGGRALAAARVLLSQGFANLRVHLGSLAGSRDAFGRLEPGWLRAGYLVTSSPTAGRSYAELAAAVDVGSARRQVE